MALTILVTPIAGDTIQASIWINEFNNIYNNPISLISPLTATVDLNSQTLSNAATFSGAITFSSTVRITSIDVGHASDSTLTRASAGVIAVEGDNVLTANVHNVAAAVHGLGASVNVLGNRSASAEFVQRGSLNPAAAGVSDNPVYKATDAVTFAVAFSATPYVMPAGTTDNNADVIASHALNVSTTGFTFQLANVTSGGNFADARWVALGA